MTFLGVGNDILEIERIRKALKKHGDTFIKKIFTQAEQKYCSRFVDFAPHYAARFSAKESIVKALGTGFGKEIEWLDIKIINNSRGKPEVVFSEKSKLKFHNPKILLTMSHSKEYVSTVAIWIATDKAS